MFTLETKKPRKSLIYKTLICNFVTPAGLEPATLRAEI